MYKYEDEVAFDGKGAIYASAYDHIAQFSQALGGFLSLPGRAVEEVGMTAQKIPLVGGVVGTTIKGFGTILKVGGYVASAVIGAIPAGLFGAAKGAYKKNQGKGIEVEIDFADQWDELREEIAEEGFISRSDASAIVAHRDPADVDIPSGSLDGGKTQFCTEYRVDEVVGELQGEREKDGAVLA